MIEELQPYAEYKESGSKWLGKVPSRWEAVPLGRPLVQRIEQNRPVKTKDILSLSLRQGVIPYSEKKSGGNKAKDDLSAYTLAYPGDIVLNSMNVVVGSVGLSKYFGAVSPVYYVLHPRRDKDSIHFFDTLFQDKTFQQSLWGLGNGILFLQSKATGKFNTIRMRIPMHALRRVVIPLPPPDEQAAIVRFLDHANRKIDGFIRAKRKLIALLVEQKQAIIHHAVTSGLNPNAPLKPSGIAWLGDIPKHWETRRLQFCIVGKLTYGANAAAEFDNRDWPRYLRITDFNNDGSLRPDTFRSLPPAVAKDYPVEDGDILFARSGATVGKAFLVRTETEKACYAGYLIRARPNAAVVIPTFLFAFTQSTAFASWKDAIFNRATIQNIGADKYANLVVSIPPIPEQQAILDFIDEDLAPLRTAITRTEREIALMQEYRTRLTADVVTGKLDVRTAAAQLPDLAANSTPDSTSNSTADLPLEEAEPDEIEP